MNTTSTVILSAISDPLRLACAGFLARYAAKALDSKRIHLERWLCWCTQVGVDPPAVRRLHVELWLRSLEDQHRASATRSAKFGVVHLFSKYAVVDEIIDRDATQNVTRPKIHEGEQKRTWLPTLDCVALLDAAVKAGPPDRPLCRVLEGVLFAIVDHREGIHLKQTCELACGASRTAEESHRR
jgi:integrase/recombinase XerD